MLYAGGIVSHFRLLLFQTILYLMEIKQPLQKYSLQLSLPSRQVIVIDFLSQ